MAGKGKAPFWGGEETVLLGDRIGQATSRACVPRRGCTILAALRGRSIDQGIDPTDLWKTEHGKVN